MDQWIDQGFTDFTKNDYYCIIRCLEKFEKDDFEGISKVLNKDKKVVERYLSVLFEKINDLEDKEKIFKNMKRKKDNDQKKDLYDNLLQ